MTYRHNDRNKIVQIDSISISHYKTSSISESLVEWEKDGEKRQEFFQIVIFTEFYRPI